MNIIIPVGGKGERFKNAGYIKSKPLIEIFEKPMIFYILDNLNIDTCDNVYIIYNILLDTEDFSVIIKKKHPYVNLISLENETRGAAETVYLGLSQIKNISKLNKNILLDCDTFYTEDIIDIYRNSKYGNIVFYSINENDKPIYSYIKLDEQSMILDIKEKNKISNNANTGAYCFENLEILIKYCKHVLDKKIVFNNEPYTSCVISEMVNNHYEFYGIELNENNVISLGTPMDVEKYKKNTKVLLFDLDGTIVDTDYLYIKVWNVLLKPYNINCDKKLFDYFIKGNSDGLFLKYIDSNITNDEIIELSDKKDSLFIEYLKDNQPILFNGVYEWFTQHRYNKIAIVTSCNKKSAEYILHITGLYKYIDLVITAEDCIKHKPDPEPYLTAISYFNTPPENVFIFEDSYSGYCSAMRTNSQNICLFESLNTCSEIINSNHFKYTDYNTLEIQKIQKFYMLYNEEHTDNYITQIYQNINTVPIKSIVKNNTNLKTGYICDINSYNITYRNGGTDQIILKVSNLDNELSDTAIKLNMYENETYFYEKISHLIENTPKYLGSFKYNKKDAIILENLYTYKGVFNINLNKNISMLLNVVNIIHHIHNSFYFISEKQLMSNMKNLKKINEIKYFKELIHNRYDTFVTNVTHILNKNEIQILQHIYDNIDNIYDEASAFPLSFCHGDLKSPNIFYKNHMEPILLDWQYIHLNKGISDIVFLLVESIDFDIMTATIVLNYYYKLQNESHPISYETFMCDFKNALCIFPFFVCVWFNSEQYDKLLDRVFPIRFLKNLMQYYNHYM
jgi:beta-phosphoglucomutase-like phosphatase (HAD superfamily)/dTDP-glucose pyrophosphorylase/thiamine kinase-like enzyme